MRQPMWSAALVVVVWGVAGGCANEPSREGGGGGSAGPVERGVSVPRDGAPKADVEAPMSITDDLAAPSRHLAETYSRAASLHAQAASGEWERALDDLHVIKRQVAEMGQDEGLTSGVKQRIGKVQPLLSRLDGEVQKHDKASVATASRLVDAFASLINDPAVQTWLGDEKGGTVYP